MRAAALIAMLAGAGALTSLGKDLDRTHAAVVAVGVDQPNRGVATGTVVSARVVVTAAHVSPAPSPDQPPWAVAIGPNAFMPAKRIRMIPERGSRPHPLFLSSVEQFGRNPTERPDFVDIGLLVLPEATDVPPAALPTSGMLDTISSSDRFLGVGYGYHEIIRPDDVGVSSPADGNRRQWRVGIRVLNGAWVRLDDDPARGYGQICRGDSGAPIFLQRAGREVLVAVVSHSDGQGCGPGIPTYAARVDNPAVLAWIEQATTASK